MPGLPFLSVGANQCPENRQKRDQDLQMQFEAWLKPPNVRETQQDQARRRLPRTCDWIWSNPTFLRWNDSSILSAPDRVFCIYGPPGSGQSILASAIVDRLWNEKVSTLFYTFSGMNASHQKSNGLIRSLLWQLVETVIQKQSTSLLSTLMLMGQPTTSDLWTGINEIAHWFQNRFTASSMVWMKVWIQFPNCLEESSFFLRPGLTFDSSCLEGSIHFTKLTLSATN